MDPGRVVFDSGLARLATPAGGGPQMLLFGGSSGAGTGAGTGGFFRGELTVHLAWDGSVLLS